MTLIPSHQHNAFVSAQTEATSLHLVPAIALHLATDPIGIFGAAETACLERPYWAFAWPGGQALARFILDNPELVAAKRILDIGAGSGLTAIAALKAGAAEAIANDTDPVACAAARRNAEANGVALTIAADDLLDAAPVADLIVIGDLFYEADLAARTSAFLRRATSRGATVLYGDRSTTTLPPLDWRKEAEYAAPLTPAMEPGYVEHGRVWRLR